MPMPAESLTPDSTDADIKSAISSSIKMCMDEGGKQDQCVAIAYSMAKRATGGTRSPEGRIRAGLEKK